MSSLATPIDVNTIDADTINLVNGFFRNIEKTMRLTIPKPINSIVIAFYYIAFRFDICTDKTDVIKDDGKTFRV